MTIPFVQGFGSTDNGDGGVGRKKINVEGMHGDRSDARHEENDGEEGKVEENAHPNLHERR